MVLLSRAIAPEPVPSAEYRLLRVIDSANYSSILDEIVLHGGFAYRMQGAHELLRYSIELSDQIFGFTESDFPAEALRTMDRYLLRLGNSCGFKYLPASLQRVKQ